jgi:hypothetical protein
MLAALAQEAGMMGGPERAPSSEPPNPEQDVPVDAQDLHRDVTLSVDYVGELGEQPVVIEYPSQITFRKTEFASHNDARAKAGEDPLTPDQYMDLMARTISRISKPPVAKRRPRRLGLVNVSKVLDVLFDAPTLEPRTITVTVADLKKTPEAIVKAHPRVKGNQKYQP